MTRENGLSLITTRPKKDSARGEGVAILVKKGLVRNVSPSLQQLWEHNIAVAIVHIKERGRKPMKMALLSFYSPHVGIAQADAKLKLLTTSIKEFHDGIDVIVCGDFNRRLSPIQKLASLCNLQVREPKCPWS